MLKKWRYWVIGVLFAIALVATLTILIANSHRKPVTTISSTQTSQALSLIDLRKQNAPMSKELAGQADVAIEQASLDAKKYQEAIKQVKAIYDDTGLSVATRIEAYSICIQAALANNKDTAASGGCKDGADKLLAGATLVSDEKAYYDFEIKVALGEAKQSDFGGANAGR